MNRERSSRFVRMEFLRTIVGVLSDSFERFSIVLSAALPSACKLQLVFMETIVRDGLSSRALREVFPASQISGRKDYVIMMSHIVNSEHCNFYGGA